MLPTGVVQLTCSPASNTSGDFDTGEWAPGGGWPSGQPRRSGGGIGGNEYPVDASDFEYPATRPRRLGRADMTMDGGGDGRGFGVERQQSSAHRGWADV